MRIYEYWNASLLSQRSYFDIFLLNLKFFYKIIMLTLYTQASVSAHTHFTHIFYTHTYIILKYVY